MKESSKKKLLNTWADHVEKWKMNIWQREQKVEGNGGEED